MLLFRSLMWFWDAATPWCDIRSVYQQHNTTPAAKHLLYFRDLIGFQCHFSPFYSYIYKWRSNYIIIINYIVLIIIKAIIHYVFKWETSFSDGGYQCLTFDLVFSKNPDHSWNVCHLCPAEIIRNCCVCISDRRKLRCLITELRLVTYLHASTQWAPIRLHTDVNVSTWIRCHGFVFQHSVCSHS